MRGLLLVLVLILPGCMETGGPPLGDRGQLPNDIEAPPPEDFGEEVAYDPPGTPAIRGRVLADGKPVGGARVWVETVDIRQFVDNVAAYEANRSLHLTTTDAKGAFNLRLEGAFYHIAIEARGFRMLRTQPIEPGMDGRVIDFALRPKDLTVTAHRGASFYAPENTLPSLWKARRLGADAVEIDLRLTADGHVVVFHDPDLERTTNGYGMVRYTTLEQMQQLDAGAWFHPSFAGTHVPTLQEFLDAAAEIGMPLVLDVKAPPDRRTMTWRAVLDMVQEAGAQDRVTFAVFREQGVQMCAARSAMKCAWIRSDSTGYSDLPTAAQAYGAHLLMVNHTGVDRWLIDSANQRGLAVHAWTLNHPDEWRPILSHGVHGILTDRMGYLVDDLNGVPVDAP